MRITDLIDNSTLNLAESADSLLLERPVQAIAQLDDRTMLVDINTVKNICNFNLGQQVTQQLLSGMPLYDGYLNPYDIANKLHAMQSQQPGIIRFFKQLGDPNLAPKSILYKLLKYSKTAKFYKQNGIR